MVCPSSWIVAVATEGENFAKTSFEPAFLGVLGVLSDMNFQPRSFFCRVNTIQMVEVDVQQVVSVSADAGRRKITRGPSGALLKL